MAAIDWATAACLDTDPEAFFPIGSGEASLSEAETAKAICQPCAMREACLDWAIDTDQRFGIWGGENVEERAQEKQLRAKNGRYLAAMS